jgi:hypothetical protein
MESVLWDLIYEASLVYLDDTIVIGRTFKEHLDNLRKVFHRLRGAHLKMNPEMCRLFQRKCGTWDTSFPPRE